jgi:hypothetical protein
LKGNIFSASFQISKSQNISVVFAFVKKKKKMDTAHEQELARILANRKKGGRLLGAPPSTSNEPQQQQSRQHQQPLQAPSQTPINNNNRDIGIQPHSPNQPLAATNRVSDTLGSGAIVIEEQQQSTNKFAPSNSNNNRYQTTTDVTSKTTVVRPTNINAGGETSQEVAELERIRRQGEDQARQIQQLQSTLDQLIQLQRSQNNNNNNNNYNFGSSNYNNDKALNQNLQQQQQQPTQLAPPPPQLQRQQQTSPGNNRNRGNVENTFDQAASIGIFVKPHRSVGNDGRGYITFNTPSRNQLGLHPASTSPNRAGSAARLRNQQQQQQNAAATKSRGVVLASGNNKSSPARSVNNNNAAAGIVTSPNNQQVAVRLPKPGPTERIPKPYSTSTLDIDSAVVLLTTGDWFYKLRVQIQSASIVGPAGWQVEASERRYVYLDTTTFILKWGDKPGGDATVFSHYVPIDHITSVNIFAQSEASAHTPEPRIIYYIVMQVVEGGFHARGRAVQRRLCVIATELRDKADMWYDALNTIKGFYRSKGAASQLVGKTFSSD